jgi:hypothetical protein
MTHFLRLITVFIGISLSHFVVAEEMPNWLIPIVKSYSEAKSGEVKIAEFEYKNKIVYVVDKGACCDLGATMYSETGVPLCNFIGIAGAWEKPCSDFRLMSKLIRVIYERKMAPNPSFKRDAAQKRSAP